MLVGERGVACEQLETLDACGELKGHALPSKGHGAEQNLALTNRHDQASVAVEPARSVVEALQATLAQGGRARSAPR